MSSVEGHLKQGGLTKQGNIAHIVHEGYLTWDELPIGEKFNLLKQEQIDKISKIPYWLRIAEIAVFSRHPHSRVIKEGLNGSDIDVAKTKIALAFGAAVLALASGAFINIIGK